MDGGGLGLIPNYGSYAWVEFGARQNKCRASRGTFRPDLRLKRNMTGCITV